jgi:D-alanyl-D-alanine-carboxypeptidase/D-alanyl-D-alanine-endopeptidase
MPREVAQRTDKPLPSMPVAIDVSPGVLARYIGDYQLAPGFVLTITLEGGHLMTQATGQPKVEVFAKSESEFFLKVVDAQISFVADESGKIEKLILHQGGRDIPASRVK